MDRERTVMAIGKVFRGLQGLGNLFDLLGWAFAEVRSSGDEPAFAL